MEGLKRKRLGRAEQASFVEANLRKEEDLIRCGRLGSFLGCCELNRTTQLMSFVFCLLYRISYRRGLGQANVQ